MENEKFILGLKILRGSISSSSLSLLEDIDTLKKTRKLKTTQLIYKIVSDNYVVTIL